MTDETKAEQKQEEQIQLKKVEYDSLLQKVEHLTGEVNKLANHNERLFNETKKAKETVKEKEAVLKNAGDYEQLFKSAEEKRKELENKLEQVHNERTREKIKLEAMRLASSQGLAEGDNAEILSHFIEKRLTVTTDGNLKVLDANGNLTVSSLDDLKQEFIRNPKFASLITSTKASGGGATGSRSGASNLTLKRNDFDQLPPAERQKIMKSREYTLVD
jgi:hypothetical protein